MLRQANNSNPTGTVKYEGRFEIISLSGSFLNSERNENHGGVLDHTLSHPAYLHRWSSWHEGP
ncbi:hypothetical protein ISN44_As04g042050 [Arabidopsis suecica]|nr:AT hook motif DNA-binding family protein [Arabidopsis thaliana]AEE87139.1 AT hook motif DNA-binding family protein [Arabidopsis thaliana]KAG7623511.1 hypothetical protein ISN44_As04g042050 [Arabidopsis suecica]CAA0398063.1 unnamed protein product [Arabidopsis thaliana]|eukprot:NP_001190975.1 AT hook motif DNA-binding family protein [Arabidopsis thaliana]